MSDRIVPKKITGEWPKVDLEACSIGYRPVTQEELEAASKIIANDMRAEIAVQRKKEETELNRQVKECGLFIRRRWAEMNRILQDEVADKFPEVAPWINWTGPATPVGQQVHYPDESKFLKEDVAKMIEHLEKDQRQPTAWLPADWSEVQCHVCRQMFTTVEKLVGSASLVGWTCPGCGTKKKVVDNVCCQEDAHAAEELIKLLKDKEAVIAAALPRKVPLPPEGRVSFPKNPLSWLNEQVGAATPALPKTRPVQCGKCGKCFEADVTPEGLNAVLCYACKSI